MANEWQVESLYLETLETPTPPSARVGSAYADALGSPVPPGQVESAYAEVLYTFANVAALEALYAEALVKIGDSNVYDETGAARMVFQWNGSALIPVSLLTLPVVPPFTPASIAGLAGWYDASQLSLADGALVSSWPDLSGNNRPLVSSPGTIAGSPPSCKVNGLNGKRVVHYTTNGDNVLTNTVAGGASYGHFFLVARFASNAFPDYNGLLSGLGGDQYLLIGVAGGTIWYGPGGGGTWDYYYNGVDSRSGLPAPMQTWAHMSICRLEQYTGFSLSIGLDRTFAPRYWHGDVAEVIAYDHRLTTPERVQVEDYLKAKWALP
jgi:hypothetical protein